MPEVSTRTAETALFELDQLIEDTDDEGPDPLTDAVFTARDELEDIVGDSESRQVTDNTSVTANGDGQVVITKGSNEVVLESREFKSAITVFAQAGGLD